MRISVEHSTVYRYPTAVQLEPHTFRLRPRMTTTQWLLAFDLQIMPRSAGMAECLDQDGNLAVRAWFSAPTQELSVLSRCRVELVRENPFDFLLSDESMSLPLWYPEPLCRALAPYRCDGHVSESVKQYAHSVAAGAQGNTLSFLGALNQQIFQSFRQMTRPEGPAWTSDVTFQSRQGSCRDLAVLFCDVCRVMGIAARFVSGYEIASAGLSDAYMHAWAEVYLPSVGWRGYDPARGLVVANSHIAVAAAFHYDLASPVAGGYLGSSGAEMNAHLSLRVDPALAT
jgi:transglutaminase-like putative cysteine protease